MKDKDLKILAQLRCDARMSLTTMSKKIGVPVSTIFDRIRFNEDRIIAKHTTLLNFSNIGFNTRANIMLRVDRDDKDRIKDYLIKNNSVNSFYKINNGFNFLVECVFKEMKDAEEFIEELEKSFKIEEKKVCYIIEDIKREEFMSDSDLIFEAEQ